RILLFGATGASGQQILTQALASGFAVTAFVRNPAKVQTANANLTVVRGDVRDADAVRAAVAGHDAVLCALGAPARDRSGLRATGTVNIVRAMRAHGVRRLVVQSSHGIGDSAVGLPWWMRWLLVPLYLANAFADHEAQEAAVRSSELDWTLVRPPHLTDGPLSGEVGHGYPMELPLPSTKISRADVAQFMLEQLDAPGYIRRTVAIAA
ncbi:MAG: putative NADH-flavin reductase, partial [Myxococcota bacterium]